MSEFKSGDVVEYIKESRTTFTNGNLYTVGGKYHGTMSGRLGVVSDDLGNPNGLPYEYFHLIHNSPVRTETITRTVIEPGVYGRLQVIRQRKRDGTIGLKLTTEGYDGHHNHYLNPSELRELARIATELADGLDAQ
jgi:hypothetical protein